MNTDWTGKTWRIVTPGCGLSSGDVLRFVGSDIQVKPNGSAAFEAAWGTYSNNSAVGCAVQAFGSLYTIQCDGPNRETLVCTSNSESCGTVADTGFGLLWSAPSATFTDSAASTSFSLFLGQAEGPSGPSWTAIEGG